MEKLFTLFSIETKNRLYFVGKRNLKQKTMKSILTILLLTSSFCGISQTNFYQENGKKIPIIGESTTLRFSEKITIEAETKYEVIGPLIASLIPSIIDLGFKISSDAIEKNLKKYTSEFSTKNTYRSVGKYISDFKVERQIMLRGESNKKTAFSIEFIPLKVDSNTFVFAVSNASVTYSGAKSKKGFNYNDYSIEIKVSYYDGKEKKEQTSSPISLQLVSIKPQTIYSTTGTSASDYLYTSDKFPLNPGFTISEVSVKIIETNTAKVNAEKIKSISDKYSDDAKNMVKTIVNYYIEKPE